MLLRSHLSKFNFSRYHICFDWLVLENLERHGVSALEYL
jgi:hypothetical protein